MPQLMYSPYMLGRSPRRYASNVRFKTADHAKSRSSSSTVSSDQSRSAKSRSSSPHLYPRAEDARRDVGVGIDLPRVSPGRVGDGPLEPLPVCVVAPGDGEDASLAARSRPRAIRSVAWNRGPRSGKLRDWSKGIHLDRDPGQTRQVQLPRPAGDAPEVVEVVREGALEEPVKARRERRAIDLLGRIEKVLEPLEIRLRGAISLIVFAVEGTIASQL